MNWLAQLTEHVQPLAWSGPSALHLKLSAGDVEEVEPGRANLPAEKACTRCRRLLPLTKYYFFVNRREKTGFMCECKECHKARDREAAQRRYAAKKALSEHEFKVLSGGAA